jgi:hypothetical protein
MALFSFHHCQHYYESGQPRRSSVATERGAVSEPGYVTLSEAIDDLARRGFTEHFGVAGGEAALRVLGTGTTLRAGDLRVREYYRFEGVSDPDDMTIVYALETRTGVRGTLVDAFGVYADPGVSAAMRDVSMPGHKPERLTWDR